MECQPNKTVDSSAGKIPEVPLIRLETLWLQVGGTLCNLQCTHCFVSCGPKNHSHEMMSLSQVRGHLEASKDLEIKDYYITGGEIFINPEIFEILEEILKYGPLNMLTNGTLLTLEKSMRLKALQEGSAHTMTFRVSMEHFEQQENDKVRGKDSYDKALKGVQNLAKAGFSPILTITRSWDEENDAKMEKQFLNLLLERKVQNPRVKILPPFLIGRQALTNRPYNTEERVTEKCFENYEITNLQCSSCRMATSKGVYVCPILVDEPVGLMGNSIKETLQPFPLSHPACYTCRVTGMTCKN